MSEMPEGIGGRKWSLLRVREDAIAVMEGKTEIAMVTSAPGDKVKELLVTAPQLWAAANEFVKLAKKGSEHNGDPEFEQLANMVAKAVGKTSWDQVAQ